MMGYSARRAELSEVSPRLRSEAIAFFQHPAFPKGPLTPAATAPTLSVCRTQNKKTLPNYYNAGAKEIVRRWKR